ncbi:MAG: DNA-binding response regulator [Candidatus Kapaibacterium sp.]|nr:MAG: DNA-binding response regulator [Candidatus Kapabacteria bacterium]
MRIHEERLCNSFLCAMQYRIVLIESRVELRNGLFLLFNAMPQIDCLAMFPNAASALAALPDVQPDVVLTALDLPDVPDAAAYIRQLSCKAPPILLLKNTESDELLAESIESGAMGYLPKSSSLLVLQEMILNLASARVEISAPNAHVLLHHLLHFSGKQRESIANLLDADLYLLQLFAHGYTTNDIAEQCAYTSNDVKAHTFLLLRRIQALHRELPRRLQNERYSESNISRASPMLYREKAA